VEEKNSRADIKKKMKLHYLTPFSWLGEGDFWSGHLFIEFQSSWFLPVYEFSG
jgi:hypothetical protein